MRPRYWHIGILTDIDSLDPAEGDFVYLDDAIFSGEARDREDLSYWIQDQAVGKRNAVPIMVIAVHQLGRYWIREPNKI